jgi:hypothetical protein
VIANFPPEISLFSEGDNDSHSQQADDNDSHSQKAIANDSQ